MNDDRVARLLLHARPHLSHLAGDVGAQDSGEAADLPPGYSRPDPDVEPIQGAGLDGDEGLLWARGGTLYLFIF